MKVKNMKSPRTGRSVPNQFIITTEGRGALGNFIEKRVFQSYATIIASITVWEEKTRIELDARKWNYSKKTSKYRNIFLGETTKETEAKIKSGEGKEATT